MKQKSSLRKTPLKNKRKVLKKTNALKRTSIGKNKKKQIRKKEQRSKRRRSSPLWNEVIKCDQAFSQYIRLLHADKNGEVKCYTCEFKSYWKQAGIEAGHFKGRSHMNTRWLASNVKPQCIKCNQFLQGNIEMFTKNLVKEYGEDFLVWVEIQSKKNAKISTAYVKKLRLYFEKEVIRLKQELYANSNT